MKMTVIFGAAQMTLGVLMIGLNALNHNSAIDFIFFIPPLFFLLALFFLSWT
jgi:hypothetical protein